MAELVEAAEVVEGVVEGVAEGARVIGVWPAVVGGALFGVTGAAAGYFFAERKLRLKYEQLAEDEIADMRDHFRARLVARETPKPDVQDLGKITEELGYDKPSQPWPASDPKIPDVEEVDGDVETHNVFETYAWDIEAEKAKRNEDDPYVIHVDERSEDEYTQTTMTYYEGDDVLTDSSDRVVHEVDSIVGIENMDRFGHGSNDPNLVYIRNEKLAVDIEVVKSEGTYEEEVMGLKHSEAHDHPRAWDG